MTGDDILVFDRVEKTFAGAGWAHHALTLGRANRSPVVALRGVSIRVAAGEIVGLLGPNGSGKSTLMRCAAGLLTPSVGTVRTFGLDPALPGAEARGRIGFVIRDDRAFNQRLTGRENLRFFGMLQRIPPGALQRAVSDALEKAMLADVGDRAFRTYSSGMKQRLALARALLGDPRLILMDEASTGLDPGLRETFHRLVRTMADSHSIGVLFATHDLSEARELCDRTVLLVDGRVSAEGPWQVVGPAASRVFGLEGQ